MFWFAEPVVSLCHECLIWNDYKNQVDTLLVRRSKARNRQAIELGESTLVNCTLESNCGWSQRRYQIHRVLNRLHYQRSFCAQARAILNQKMLFCVDFVRVMKILTSSILILRTLSYFTRVIFISQSYKSIAEQSRYYADTSVWRNVIKDEAVSEKSVALWKPSLW